MHSTNEALRRNADCCDGRKAAKAESENAATRIIEVASRSNEPIALSLDAPHPSTMSHHPPLLARIRSRRPIVNESGVRGCVEAQAENARSRSALPSPSGLLLDWNQSASSWHGRPEPKSLKLAFRTGSEAS